MPCGSRRTPLLLLSAVAAFSPMAAIAQSTGLEDLVGARAGQAENALRARGYDFVRSETGDDRKYSYWWSQERRLCVAITTMDGRYNAITATLPPDCERPAGPATRPSIEVKPIPAPSEAPPGPVIETRPTRPPAPPPPPSVMVDGRLVELGLVCFGEGQKPKTATTYGWTWNADRDRYEYGNRLELQTQAFDATVTVQIWEDGGRIRLPRSLIPPIVSRGDHGWWDLSDVVVARDRVTARYRLNSLNKPAVAIDRRTGRITIQGTSSYGFRGECELLDHDDRRRF